MIFEKILDGLTTLIVWIAKLVLFLLKALGLWIPAAFSVIFLIVCWIFGLNLSECWPLFILGIVVSTLIAVYIMCLRVMNANSRRFKAREKKRAEAKKREEEKQSDREAKRAVKESKMLERNFDEMQRNEKAKPEIERTDDSNEGFAPYFSPNPAIRPDAPQPTAAPSDKQEEAREEKVAGNGPSLARPVIYRTRIDPNMLIYEYADRFVYYRRSPLGGLEHVKTERKRDHK
jgi:hypothetical protein